MPGLPANIQALILDMDGVLWRDSQALLDMPAFFRATGELGIPVVFATNNGTRSIDMYVERLASFGVSVEPWQIVNSAIAVADYASKTFAPGSAIYVVAETGVKQALAEKGFVLLDDTTPPERDAEAAAVVVGMDRSMSYDKIARAALLIRSGRLFIATNPDLTFPTPYGLVPGAGAIIAMIEAATSVPPVMIGKPEPYMYNFAIQRLGTDPAETLAVGDRFETDIVGGQRAGCPTLLVLSGVTAPEEVPGLRFPPDLVLPNLADLLPLLIEMRQRKAIQ